MRNFGRKFNSQFFFFSNQILILTSCYVESGVSSGVTIGSAKVGRHEPRRTNRMQSTTFVLIISICISSVQILSLNFTFLHNASKFGTIFGLLQRSNLGSQNNKLLFADYIKTNSVDDCVSLQNNLFAVNNNN